MKATPCTMLLVVFLQLARSEARSDEKDAILDTTIDLVRAGLDLGDLTNEELAATLPKFDIGNVTFLNGINTILGWGKVADALARDDMEGALRNTSYELVSTACEMSLEEPHLAFACSFLSEKALSVLYAVAEGFAETTTSSLFNFESQVYFAARSMNHSRDEIIALPPGGTISANPMFGFGNTLVKDRLGWLRPVDLSQPIPFITKDPLVAFKELAFAGEDLVNRGLFAVRNVFGGESSDFEAVPTQFFKNVESLWQSKQAQLKAEVALA